MKGKEGILMNVMLEVGYGLALISGVVAVCDYIIRRRKIRNVSAKSSNHGSDRE
jgi:cytosine/uracil/thiamine/allantoin permease